MTTYKYDVNVQTGKSTKTAVSAQEEIEIANAKSAFIAGASMRNWKSDMASFKLTREMEEHIQAKHAGIADTPYQQAIYDLKVARRSQRP